MSLESPTQDIRLGEMTAKWARANHLFADYKPTLASTSDIAKEKAFDEELLSEAVCLFLTDLQTQGRGRNKNTWTSPSAGSALISSWSYLVNTLPQPTLAPLMGLALYRALSSTWPFMNWSLKAPNDIFLNGKKVAGLLIENVTQGDETRIIIGLGLNVFSHPKEISHSTSIAESLPEGTPLLGQDYMSFLDRLFFEMTDAISNCAQELTPTDQQSLKMIINKGLSNDEAKVDFIDAKGSITYSDGSQKHWSQI